MCGFLPPSQPTDTLCAVDTRRVEVFLFRKDLGTTRQFSLQGRSDTVNPQAGDQLRPASVSVTCTSAPDASRNTGGIELGTVAHREDQGKQSAKVPAAPIPHLVPNVPSSSGAAW